MVLVNGVERYYGFTAIMNALFGLVGLFLGACLFGALVEFLPVVGFYFLGVACLSVFVLVDGHSRGAWDIYRFGSGERG